MFGERDVQRFKHSITVEQFTGWVAYLEIEEDSRSKLDCYLAAIRFDINTLTNVVQSMFGGSPHRARVEDMFLTGKEAEEFKPPEGYYYDPTDPIRGDANYDKAYGLPGIEIGEAPLDEKWQKVNNEEKQKWEALAKIGLVEMVPPDAPVIVDTKVKSDG